MNTESDSVKILENLKEIFFYNLLIKNKKGGCYFIHVLYYEFTIQT